MIILGRALSTTMTTRAGQFPSHIERLRQGMTALELPSIPHGRWPLPPVSSPPIQSSRSNISILDSSFNPPTLAHLALANIPLSKAFRCTHIPQTPDCCTFHAKLLLLSVRNADKSLKPGDANYDQRMAMMDRLAQDIEPDIIEGSDDDAVPARNRHTLNNSNTAVALIDEPTFVGKARILLEFFHKALSSQSITPSLTSVSSIDDSVNGETSADSDLRTVAPELTFIVGIDTLERLFASRYYLSEEDMHQRLSQFFSPDGDNCRVICARRITPDLAISEDEREHAVKAAAKTWIDSDRIALVDIPDDVRAFSSSETRAAILAGSPQWTKMVTSKVADYIIQHNLYWQPPP